MTTFGELTTTDHRGLHLDLSYNKLLKQKVIENLSPFNRKLRSKYSTSVRLYRNYLEKKVTTQNLEVKVKALFVTAQQQKLNREEDESLNKVDNQITLTMLNTEKKINTQQTTPWSPELNTAIRTVTLWKLTLTQLKTKISQHKSITTIQQALTTTIDLT